MPHRKIGPSASDNVTTLVRGLSGFAGPGGSLIAELVTACIPAQRMDRAEDFLRKVAEQIKTLDLDVTRLREALLNPHRVAILEEGVEQAVRAHTERRREWLARIVARGISEADFDYEKMRTILDTIRLLNDAELIWLRCYQMVPGERRLFIAENEEILGPASTSIAARRQSGGRERGILQDAWKRSLDRMGLVNDRGGEIRPSLFGRLILSYLFPPTEFDRRHGKPAL